MSVIASTTERSRRSIHQAAASAARTATARPAIQLSVSMTVTAGAVAAKSAGSRIHPAGNQLATLNFHRKINLNESRRPL